MIKRISTPRRGPNRVRIRTRRKNAVITTDEAANLGSERIHHKINQQLRQWLELTVHKNRDGTIAVAYGKAPDVWPEDEVIEVIKR